MIDPTTDTAEARSGAPAPDRPLRADAQRNRERIIVAAGEAFREQGLDVSVAEIARRAGVGSGTLFRNFPTKRDLMLAIVEEATQEWTRKTEEILAQYEPAEAFEAFVIEAGMGQSENRSMFDAIKEGLYDDPAMVDCKAHALGLADRVIANAQIAGVVRSDVTSLDIQSMVTGAIEAAERTALATGGDPPYERYLRLTGRRPAHLHRRDAIVPSG